MEAIEHLNAKVRCPRTKGFVERMNRTLLDERFRHQGRSGAAGGIRPSMRSRSTSTPSWPSTASRAPTRAAAWQAERLPEPSRIP